MNNNKTNTSSNLVVIIVKANPSGCSPQPSSYPPLSGAQMRLLLPHEPQYLIPNPKTKNPPPLSR